jgi:ribonuclease HII
MVTMPVCGNIGVDDQQPFIGVDDQQPFIGVDDQQPFIGVDEVARGCIWGRVYVAAVGNVPNNPPVIIKDSKTMTKKQRRISAAWIREHCDWCVSWHNALDIDLKGIDNAIWECMDCAINDVKTQVGKNCVTLVDGNRFGGTSEVTTVVGGDATYPCIAAASILAKNTHDQWVIDVVGSNSDLERYGLGSNMGYGSSAHMKAIDVYGVEEEHRYSYLKKWF